MGPKRRSLAGRAEELASTKVLRATQRSTLPLITDSYCSVCWWFVRGVFVRSGD